METNVDQVEELFQDISLSKTETGNLSIFEKICRAFPSVKRKSSDSSTGSEDRRESLRSTSSLGSGLNSRRSSTTSTFGNHGTMVPHITVEDQPEPSGHKKERCPLSRCLQSREARIRKKILSQQILLPSHTTKGDREEEYLLHTGNGLLMFPNRL